ncbi:MAG: CopL family metal-binding regulatory protein [Gammaproteobacteria bacterium]|nr:CopL family metal-binding regulatory protein [Gammaproteobacteria bacterium]
MHRHQRCLQVFLVLALIIHGGVAPLHVTAAQPPAEIAAATAASQAAAAEQDCHGSPKSPAPAQEQAHSGPCEHGDCSVCFCALPQPAAMVVVIGFAASDLASEKRSRSAGSRHLGPPPPLLRPPIA